MHITFTNGLKKRRKIVQLSFYFCQLMIMKEVCSGIKYVDPSMKLHAAFPSTPNKLWMRNTSCFCQNCFKRLSSLKQLAIVEKWLICSERGIP